MSEPEFKDGDLVEKVGGRYGGPGRIVGNTIALDDSGYRLWNVAMRVAGGYGEFVHVFPSGVLRPRVVDPLVPRRPAEPLPPLPILERIERAIAMSCNDDYSVPGTIERARHCERIGTLSAAYDEIVAARRQCEGLAVAAIANGEGLLRFEGAIRDVVGRLSAELRDKPAEPASA